MILQNKARDKSNSLISRQIKTGSLKYEKEIRLYKDKNMKLMIFFKKEWGYQIRMNIALLCMYAQYMYCMF